MADLTVLPEDMDRWEADAHEWLKPHVHGVNHRLAADRVIALIRRIREVTQQRDQSTRAFAEQFDQREEYVVECKRLWSMEERVELLRDEWREKGKTSPTLTFSAFAAVLNAAIKGEGHK